MENRAFRKEFEPKQGMTSLLARHGKFGREQELFSFFMVFFICFPYMLQKKKKKNCTQTMNIAVSSKSQGHKELNNALLSGMP